MGTTAITSISQAGLRGPMPARQSAYSPASVAPNPFDFFDHHPELLLVVVDDALTGLTVDTSEEIPR